MSIKPLFGMSWGLAPAFAGAAARPSDRLAANSGRTHAWLAAAASGEGPDDDTIQVQRRRPSGPGSGPRERAEAPERQRPDEGSGNLGGSGRPGGSGGGGSSRPPSGGGGPSGGNIPGFSGGCRTIMMGALIVIAVVAYLIFNSSNAPQSENPQGQPDSNTQASEAVLATPQGQIEAAPTQSRPADLAQPTAPSSVNQVQPTAVAPDLSTTGTGGQKWTVMLYQDADDKVLEEDIYFDLNEAERVGSSARVNVVAQMDRYRAGFQGDGNWVGARRFYVTRDADLHRVGSRQLADMGQVNMSDPQTLVDFVTWAMKAYPADKYALILSDHGMGWPGGFSDSGSRRNANANIPLAAALGNQMLLMDLDKALGAIRSRSGLDKFELIGLDACLMSQLEVYSALAPHARYAVASEETEPALGWAYTAFLTALTRNPDGSGAELGRQIVQSYIQQDQRIVDDQARGEYMRRGSPMGDLFGMLGEPGSDQLARDMGDSITLTTLDLSAFPALQQSVNEFAYALQGVPQQTVDQARTYAQSYTSIFGDQVPASYIDLGHFVALAARAANNANVSSAADRVQNAIKTAVLAEKHGPKKPGSTGISIYFPNSRLYRTPESGPQSYTAIAQRFAGESLWPNFLAFHYTGRKFAMTTREAAVPDRATTIVAPGAGQFSVSPVRLSGKVASPGHPITMKADVSGENVGHVYFFTGFYDKKANSINVADTDYLDSPQTRQLDGVYYPDWGGRKNFTLEFSWEPLMFAVTDGESSAQVLLSPQSYGAAREQAVYTVDGTYTFKDGGDSRSARLYFSNGLLRQVMGFTGDQQNGAGAPHEITPQPGDQFTVLQHWLDLDTAGKVTGEATQEGKTLTFGASTFTWKELDAAVGDYVVGFVVEDLDGNKIQSFTQVRVQ